MERRRRLGPESAARKALIASSYRPARPEVYNLLQVPGRGQVTGRRWRHPGLGAVCPMAGVFCPQEATLAPEFLAAAEYSASSGADLKGLLQRLETVSGEVLACYLAGLGVADGGPFTHHICL